jgi:hypothetical protein
VIVSSSLKYTLEKTEVIVSSSLMYTLEKTEVIVSSCLKYLKTEGTIKNNPEILGTLGTQDTR